MFGNARGDDDGLEPRTVEALHRPQVQFADGVAAEVAGQEPDPQPVAVRRWGNWIAAARAIEASQVLDKRPVVESVIRGVEVGGGVQPVDVEVEPVVDEALDSLFKSSSP